MKLSEYFQQQKSHKMPSHLKSEIFSRIQKEKSIWIQISTKFVSRKFFFASKQFMYASLATLLAVVVFWGLFLDQTDRVDFGIFSIQKHLNPNGVLADYVAEVIEFNGEYSLQRDKITISNLQELKLIESGDIVFLQQWTELIFTLKDGTQARIVGPAEFSIIKWKKWYQIFLVDGKFFRIYSPECISDMEIITPDLSIHHNKNQALDLHIAKEDDWEVLVKNDWGEITVTSTKSEHDIETKLNSADLVAISPNSKSLEILSWSDLMAAFMAKNNISSTFTLSRDKVEWPTIQPNISTWTLAMNTNTQASDKDNLDTSTWIMNSDSDPLLEWIIDVLSSDFVITWTINEEISSELWLATDWLQVPSADQLQSLKTNINSFFLMNLFESIYVDNVSTSKFAERINAISSSFGYSDRASSDLSSIKNLTLTLKSKLQQERYIAPSYIQQLEKVANWCDELASHSVVEWETLYDQRENLKANLPAHLQLM